MKEPKCKLLKGNALRIPKYGNSLMLLMEYIEQNFSTIKISVKNYSQKYFLIRLSSNDHPVKVSEALPGIYNVILLSEENKTKISDSHFVDIENYINANI